MRKTLARGHRKLINAWAFYDWANSVYPLVVSSAVFPIFFTEKSDQAAEAGEVPEWIEFLSADSRIIATTAIGYIVISLISPLLSGIADYAGRKKQFLQFFCYLGAVCCMLLAAFSYQYLLLSLLIYMLALIGFCGSLIFYNAYLPEIAHPDQQDKVSAKGFSFGYVGSVILLLICLGLIQGGFYPEDGVIGLNAVQVSFILVGLWWLGFAQYTYRFLPKGSSKEIPDGVSVFNAGFKELSGVWKDLSSHLKMKRYLIAFFVYSMAVQTVMIVATYFGTTEVAWEEGESTTGLIVSILLIQLVAVLGAWLASKLSNRIGNIKTLIIINLIWVLICAYGFFVETPMQFYITAAAVGFVMGSIQSLSRSTYSKMIPEENDETASYFSFYDVAEKVGIVIGLFFFTLVREQFDSMRYSILFLMVFFIVGSVLLTRVNRIKSN